MYDCEITLKLATYPDTNTDEYGNLVAPTVTNATRYAERESISYKEFYEAAAKGFKPEVKFKLAERSDYNGAQQVEYDGTIYDIIRTYEPHNSREIELICTKGIV